MGPEEQGDGRPADAVLRHARQQPAQTAHGQPEQPEQPEQGRKPDAQG